MGANSADFEELLIDAIRRQPVLYDIVQLNSRSENDKKQAWKIVTADIKRIWPKATRKDCYMRWRSLRSSYGKITRKIENGAVDSKKITWKYLEQLKFLEGNIVRKNVPYMERTSVAPNDALKRDMESDDNDSDLPREFSFVETNMGSESGDRFIQDFLSESEANECELELFTAPVKKRALRRSKRKKITTVSSTSEEESDNSTLPTTTTPTTSKNIKHDDTNECVNMLFETVTDVLNRKLEKQSTTSRNAEYLRVLSGYLSQMPKHHQNSTKLEILNLVHSRKRVLDIKK